jgi:hypothetical protein
MDKPEIERAAKWISMALILIMVWNFWLPTALDFLNMQTKPPNPPNVDFLSYYRAGSRFVDGENPYFWDPGGRTKEDTSDFLYPPAVLPLYAFFSGLQYDAARYLWTGAYFAIYALAIILLAFNHARGARDWFVILGLALTFLSFPLLWHIRNGQSDMLVAGMIMLGFGLYARGNRVSAAILLGIASVIKVSPILLLAFYVLFLRDIRFLLATILTIISLGALSLIWVPLEFYGDYFLRVLPEISAGTGYWFNQSILKLIGEGSPVASVISVLGLTGMGVFFYVMGSRTTPGDRHLGEPLGESNFSPEALFFANLLFVLIFVGKAWPMAYVWVILPSAMLLLHLLKHPFRPGFVLSAVAAVALMSAKVYGVSVFGSLNLIGSILLVACLTTFVWNPDRVRRPAAAPLLP